MMKKIKQKLTFFMCIMAFAILCIQGCGNSDAKNENTEQQTENAPLEGSSETNTTQETTTETEEDTTSQLQLGNALEIPKGFEKLSAESEPNADLEKAIREYYKMTEGVYNGIGYYYNYVDLNGDSQDEILALVFHVERELDEGIEIEEEKLLWMDITDGNLTERSVLQEFEDVEIPVYISYHMTDGYRDLIFRDDTNEYVISTWNKDRYQWEDEGKEIPSVEGYEGEVILTGDGNYHLLSSTEGE